MKLIVAGVWRPGRGLTTAKPVAKVSGVSDTAGEKKSLAADLPILTIPHRCHPGDGQDDGAEAHRHVQ